MRGGNGMYTILYHTLDIEYRLAIVLASDQEMY